MREKTVCFSGHRPEKLPFNGDESIFEVKTLMSRLFREINSAIFQGYTTFVSGMAKGVDLWAAKYIIEQKEKNHSLRLICAVPYQGYGKGWKGVDKWDLNWILYKADEIVHVSENYSPYCLKKRNEYMVDNSSKLIAVVSDFNSGTGHTVRYANKNNVEVRLIKF